MTGAPALTCGNAVAAAAGAAVGPRTVELGPSGDALADGVQLETKPECGRDFEDGRPARVAVLGECLAELVAAHADKAGEFANVLRASNHVEGVGDCGRVLGRLLNGK